jgi:hypothetical protein
MFTGMVMVYPTYDTGKPKLHTLSGGFGPEQFQEFVTYLLGSYKAEQRGNDRTAMTFHMYIIDNFGATKDLGEIEV